MLDRSLIANNSGVIARGRLRQLRRAVDCFGFHLARLDIRQNSAVHERTTQYVYRAHALDKAELVARVKISTWTPRRAMRTAVCQT